VAAAPNGASSAAAYRGEWEVRVAAYSSQGLAEAERDHLRQLGFESRVVSTQSENGTSWDVLAGPVATRSEAEALRERIQERTKMQGMTVMQSG
jgi:cell division septation protein DedD